MTLNVRQFAATLTHWRVDNSRNRLLVLTLTRHIECRRRKPPALTEPPALQNLTLLHRKQSDGMDIGAHNATLEWLAARGSRRKYGAFIFLNSSARGPFFPSYMPPGWQWTMAFTQRLSASVKVGFQSKNPQNPDPPPARSFVGLNTQQTVAAAAAGSSSGRDRGAAAPIRIAGGWLAGASAPIPSLLQKQWRRR